MIIEFEPNHTLLSCPPQWWLYYKQENESEFNKISVSYEELKIYIEMYCDNNDFV